MLFIYSRVKFYFFPFLLFFLHIVALMHPTNTSPVHPRYREDRHGTHRGAILPLVVYRRYPEARWFVIGDDDTLFSPLALAQWVGNFDSADPW